MGVFELIVDEKVSVWRRTWVKIKAESLEEAVKDCIENGSSNAFDIDNSEYLYDTEEYILQDDQNPVTVEVMDTNYNELGNDISSK